MARRKSGDLCIKIPAPFTYKEKLNKLYNLYYFSRQGEDGFFVCPLTVWGIEYLEGLGFSFDNNLTSWYNRAYKPKIPDIPLLGQIKGFKKVLYPFQEQGVAFIEHHKGRCLLADEMGLGKTVQILAWLQYKQAFPVVIIVPASLKLNWYKESQVCTSIPDVIVLSGKKPQKIQAKIIIINYDILGSWLEVLLKIKPKVVVLDEAHYIKNNNTARTKAVKKLCKISPYLIGASGTPIVNRPSEMYNIIKLINPTLFPNWFTYIHTYCNARHNGFGWDYSGSKNTLQLHKILTRTLMIRRLKKDVLADLPDKSYNSLFFELDNKKEYLLAEHDIAGYLNEIVGQDKAGKAKQAETLVKIEYLKQLAIKGKFINICNWIDDFVQTGQKLVIMGIHTEYLEKIQAKYQQTSVLVYGKTSMEQRQARVEQFQTDPNCVLFIGNIKAAGVGITLTAANNILFIEYPWTPGELQQATDRCHRIGQKNAVSVYYAIADNTIDLDIIHLLSEKTKVLESIIDGILTLEINTLQYLVEKMRERQNHARDLIQ